LEAARRASEFILSQMFDSSSADLLRRSCDGDAAVPAFLDDYAFFAQATLDLFEATFETRYLALATDLATRGLARFEDQEQGGFFSTRPGERDLLLRMKDDYDGAEPSGNSVATDVLLRLAHVTGNGDYAHRAQRSLQTLTPKLKAQPTIAPQMLVAVDRSLSEPAQIVIRCGDDDSEAQNRIRAEWEREFNPASVALLITDSAARELVSIAPFLSSLERQKRLTIYRCRNFACELPEIVE
jgi:uncharacterized protein YyaL (SSP411 family)